MTTLDALKPQERGRIHSITGSPAVVQRLAELGLFEGEEIQFLGKAPLGDPLEIQVGTTTLSIRKKDAQGILVQTLTQE
jgi:ferrous iron transport protein A